MTKYIVLFCAAALASGCIFSPDKEYPIHPGRYYLESDLKDKGKEKSWSVEYSANGTWYSSLPRDSACLFTEQKGTWYVSESRLTLLVDSTNGSPGSTECVKKGVFRRETRTAYYSAIKGLTDSTYLECDNGAANCKTEKDWKKYVR